MNDHLNPLEQNEQETFSDTASNKNPESPNEAFGDTIVDNTNRALSEMLADVPCEPHFDEKKEKRRFSIIGFGLAAFSFVMIFVSSILMITVNAVAPDFAKSSLFMHAVTPVSLYLFALPILLIILVKIPAQVPEKKKLRFGTWVLFLLVGFGLMYIGAQVSSVVMGILTSILGYDPMNSLDSMVTESNIFVNFFFLVIVAPIGEEFVFRKLLIDRTQQYGCWVSALFSGVVFGLMHGNLYQCFYAFALGLLLGYLYYNTGRLLPVIGIHAVINFISGVLVGQLSENLVDMESAWNSLDMLDNVALVEFISEHGWTLLLSLLFLVVQWGTIICAIVLPIVLRKHIILRKGEVEIPRGRKFATMFLSAGTIVMFVFYFLEIGMSLLPV